MKLGLNAIAPFTLSFYDRQHQACLPCCVCSLTLFLFYCLFFAHKGVHITGSKHNPMYGDCMVKRTGAVEFSRCWKRVRTRCDVCVACETVPVFDEDGVWILEAESPPSPMISALIASC